MRELQRHRDDLKHLCWIDMLCINQNDTDERSRQVAMMREIFGYAELVVAWLGPERDNSGRVMRTLNDPSVQREYRGRFVGQLLYTRRSLLVRTY